MQIEMPAWVFLYKVHSSWVGDNLLQKSKVLACWGTSSANL